MDIAYYEEMRGLLRGLLIRIGDRLSVDERADVDEYIDHNELGLALELMAGWLSERARPITSEERADMLALSERMGMGDRVPEALALCPVVDDPS